MNYTDIHVVDTFEEAEQFRYEHNDQPVEVGTAVGYDDLVVTPTAAPPLVVKLVCFDGIYFQDND